MITETISYIILFGLAICAFLCLGASSTGNYCRCIREPRRDDDEEEENDK